MLYVVSGFMRTGTSMLMKALEAGGLDAAYRQSRETMRKHFADEHYDPNIGGLYELERSDYRHPDFPRMFDGKLVKALNNGVPNMKPMQNGIRVVFMRRNEEEIRQSYGAFFGRSLPVITGSTTGHDPHPAFTGGGGKGVPESNVDWDVFYNGGRIVVKGSMDKRMEGIIEKIKNRKDVVSFHEFWYRAVIDDPEYHFQKLKNAGWPIDVKKAAAIVDPQYCRFKREDLEIGVM